MEPLTDSWGREIRSVRVSVTDRCNFRCTYCMPRELFGPDHQFLPRTELLSFEEIARVVRLLARSGRRAPKRGPRYTPLPIARW